MSEAYAKSWLWALLGLATAFGGQLALVHGLYGGDWTALFYTGSEASLPPGMEAARAPDPVGFDGRFYRLVARDPLILGDARVYVDNPPLRWRRILVPGLAYALGLGRPGAIDFAYIAVVAGCVFCGALWLSLYALDRGLSPAVGMAFLLLPATAISIERMSVDVALAAATVGFALLVVRRPAPKPVPLHLLLILAPLARETGAACAAAWAIVQLSRRRFGWAILSLSTLLPAALWALYVRLQTSADATAWFSGLPFGGLVARTLRPFPTIAPTLGLQLAACLEYLAVIGVWAAIGLTGFLLARNRRDPLALGCAALLALFAFLAKEDIWQQVYGFGRTLSPVLLWLGLAAMRDRRWFLLAPWALVAPRILYQMALLGLAIVRG